MTLGVVMHKPQLMNGCILGRKRGGRGTNMVGGRKGSKADKRTKKNRSM